MVGLGRLELPTPALSERCSNQLSYRPESFGESEILGETLVPSIKSRFSDQNPENGGGNIGFKHEGCQLFRAPIFKGMRPLTSQSADSSL